MSPVLPYAYVHTTHAKHITSALVFPYVHFSPHLHTQLPPPPHLPISTHPSPPPTPLSIVNEELNHITRSWTTRRQTSGTPPRAHPRRPTIFLLLNIPIHRPQPSTSLPPNHTTHPNIIHNITFRITSINNPTPTPCSTPTTTLTLHLASCPQYLPAVSQKISQLPQPPSPPILSPMHSLCSTPQTTSYHPSSLPSVPTTPMITPKHQQPHILLPPPTGYPTSRNNNNINININASNSSQRCDLCATTSPALTPHPPPLTHIPPPNAHPPALPAHLNRQPCNPCVHPPHHQQHPLIPIQIPTISIPLDYPTVPLSTPPQQLLPPSMCLRTPPSTLRVTTLQHPSIRRIFEPSICPCRDPCSMQIR